MTLCVNQSNRACTLQMWLHVLDVRLVDPTQNPFINHHCDGHAAICWRIAIAKLKENSVAFLGHPVVIEPADRGTLVMSAFLLCKHGALGLTVEHDGSRAFILLPRNHIGDELHPLLCEVARVGILCTYEP